VTIMKNGFCDRVGSITSGFSYVRYADLHVGHINFIQCLSLLRGSHVADDFCLLCMPHAYPMIMPALHFVAIIIVLKS
jgi:hypothetical protein